MYLLNKHANNRKYKKFDIKVKQSYFKYKKNVMTKLKIDIIIVSTLRYNTLSTLSKKVICSETLLYLSHFSYVLIYLLKIQLN